MSGRVISIDTFLPRGKDVFFFQHKIQAINDSTLFFGALDTTNAYGVYYNTNNHKIKYSKFQPILGKYFYYNPCTFQVNGTEIYATAEWNRFRIVNGGKYIVGDMVLTKMREGHIILKKVISEMDFTLNLGNIKYNNDGTFYTLGDYTNYIHPFEEKHIFGQNIYHFDTAFNLIKRIISPKEKRFGIVNDLVKNGNGDLYCASNIETFHDTPGGTYLEEDPCISKYDSLGKYLWTKTYNNNSEFGEDKFNSITLSKDHRSILAVGIIFSHDYQDTISYSVKKGFIVSISENGDSLWQRQYIARGDEDYYNSSKFLDIKLCPDGGYLLCGSSVINPPPFPDNYSQAGWLMKVDEYGCYIPGCHLVGIKQESKDEIEIKLFPNPTSEFISVIHGYDRPLDVEIVNVNGTKIISFRKVHPLETNFLPLIGFPAGQYFMNFYNAGNLVKSKSFMIQAN